jgi:ABC-2 type transport system permease protein
MVHRIENLVWKEALQFLRHRLLLILVLVFPVWNLSSVANMVSRGILHIPTAIWDQDHSQASRQLVTTLRHSRLFDPDYTAHSQAELERLLAQGTARVGLVIPSRFGVDVAGSGAAVRVLLDGSETTTALVARAYLEGIAAAYARQVLGQQAAGWTAVVGELESVQARSRVWFNEDLRRETFQLPAEMAGAVALLAVLLPAVAIVRERESGTLEQLFVTPIRSIELIVGKSLLTLIIAYLGFLGMLALNVLHYRVPLRGSLILLMILTGFYIFVEMGWGLLVSAVARTQGQGFLGAFFVVILEVILSGQILPVEYMPQAVQVISWLAPNRHYTAIVRAIMLKGAGLESLWPQVVALGVLGAALYTLAAARLQKRLE